MSRPTLVLWCALAALMAGCATAPKPAPQLPGAECSQLRAEIARTEQEKRAALEKKENAWKVVIPFAVAAQYAAGKSAADSADKRLAELGNQSARQGCSS